MKLDNYLDRNTAFNIISDCFNSLGFHNELDSLVPYRKYLYEKGFLSVTLLKPEYRKNQYVATYNKSKLIFEVSQPEYGSDVLDISIKMWR